MSESEQLQPEWQKIESLEDFQILTELGEDTMFKVFFFCLESL